MELGNTTNTVKTHTYIMKKELLTFSQASKKYNIKLNRLYYLEMRNRLEDAGFKLETIAGRKFLVRV